MKFYLHKAVATKIGKYKLKLEEYSITEYPTFEKALKEYMKTFSVDTDYVVRNIFEEEKIIGKITTSKQSLVPRVKRRILDKKKYYLTFKETKSKYYCCRQYLELEVEYGLQCQRFIVMETNYKNVAIEYKKYMERFIDKRNTYYVTSNIENTYYLNGN